MNVTAEVQNIILKIATNRAEAEQQGAVSAIQLEMDAFETGGDPDLDQQKASYYGAQLQAARDSTKLQIRESNIRDALTTIVQAAHEPALPPPPAFVTWQSLVDHHPDCRRRRAGGKIPLIGIVVGLRDQEHNEREAHRVADQMNHDNRQRYEEDVRKAYREAYAFVLGLSVDALAGAYGFTG